MFKFNQYGLPADTQLNPIARLWMKLPLSLSLGRKLLTCAEVFYCYLGGVTVSLPGWLELNYLQNQLKLKKLKWKETFYNFCTIFPTLQRILQLLKLGSQNLICLFILTFGIFNLTKIFYYAGLQFLSTRPANDIYSQICLSKIVSRIFSQQFSSSATRERERERAVGSRN